MTDSLKISYKNLRYKSYAEEGKLRKVYEVPNGWDIGVTKDDQRFFVRPYDSLLFKYKPELREKMHRTYGDLILADKIIDLKRGVVYLPPPHKGGVLIELVVKKEGHYRVIVGARLKEVRM